MKDWKRTQKMTMSAPMKTQTPSTPGRRLDSTRLVATTLVAAFSVSCDWLPEAALGCCVFGLEAVHRLDDVVRQRRAPDEPGEERDPEVEGAVEGERSGCDERDQADREERGKG